MNSEKIVELRKKILEGLEIAFEKLVQTKIKNNDEFVFSEDGQIIIVKAEQLKK